MQARLGASCRSSLCHRKRPDDPPSSLRITRARMDEKACATAVHADPGAPSVNSRASQPASSRATCLPQLTSPRCPRRSWRCIRPGRDLRRARPPHRLLHDGQRRRHRRLRRLDAHAAVGDGHRGGRGGHDAAGHVRRDRSGRQLLHDEALHAARLRPRRPALRLRHGARRRLRVEGAGARRRRQPQGPGRRRRARPRRLHLAARRAGRGARARDRVGRLRPRDHAGPADAADRRRRGARTRPASRSRA